MNSNLSLFGLSLVTLMVAGCSGPSPVLHQKAQNRQFIFLEDKDGDDSPLKLVGERLFRETRFSQYFFAHANNGLTTPPTQGDSVVETLDTLTAQLVNPYKGQAMACAACHFVDQVKDLEGAGSRAYTDFSRRSRVPHREGDTQTLTPRNSPNMVGSTVNSEFFLHADGEFSTPEDLVRASYTGRNMGWLPLEGPQAIHHIAEVIRADQGTFPTETDLKGLSYTQLFAGAPQVTKRFLVPPEYRLDVTKASDQEIFEGVVKLVTGYLQSLDFARDPQGHYKGSPFDKFLAKNNLPQAPDAGETPLSYSDRLLKLISEKTDWQYVSAGDGQLKLHKQDFVFSETELRGLKAFLGTAHCTQCHAAPDFTDHQFHNTGVSQEEYDRVHGAGRFAALKIPSLQERGKKPDQYLPATDAHPHALGVFRSIPDLANAMKADLGVWNIFANPDYPLAQTKLRPTLCKSFELDCQTATDEQILLHSLGALKTPTLRDLGQSGPYFHNGQAETIEEALKFYVRFSVLNHENKIRNPDPKLKEVKINEREIEALSRFLQSLNEDYD